ncbi:MAG: hypothetical protein ACLP0B_04540 [Steroidobacteraceae bacterium]
MKTTWLITSAVSTNVGIYDTMTRIRQTDNTITSIKRFYPDAIIILADGGKQFDSPHEYFDQLVKRCHLFIDCRNNDDIKNLQNNVFNRNEIRGQMGGISGISKSLSELTIINFALETLKTPTIAASALDVDRVFKISGRYLLSPLFDPTVYKGVGDKYVFRQRQPSWMKNAPQRIGSDSYFSSRLWSFAPSQLDDTLNIFTNMIKNLGGLRAHSYVDVEHLLFKYFSHKDIHELEYTHVMGTIAPNGTMTYD